MGKREKDRGMEGGKDVGIEHFFFSVVKGLGKSV